MCIASSVVKSVPLEVMGKVKFKSLRELYDGTQKISPPKPSEFQTEEKSITSNVHATRCSSGMHFEQVASIAGVRIGSFTDKASEGKRASHCPSTNKVLFAPSLRQCASSEASDIFSVSMSLDSSLENSEGQAIFRDSCEPGGQFGDSPKGLINFGKQGFPNQLEKPNKFGFGGDNISCISKSDSIDFVIGNQNNDAERMNISSSLASVDGLPAFESNVNDRVVCLSLAGSHFHKSSNSLCGIQNFPKEPAPAGVSLPNRSDLSNISSIKDIYNSAISLEQYTSEWSDEQVESSFGRAVTNRLSGPIDGVYNYATFGKAGGQLNSEDPAIEAESHSYCERHLEKSAAVVENDIMQEPCQSQPLDDEGRVCDICGDVGRERLLAICSKCTDGAEHIYCMRVKLEKVPEGDWTCEGCLLMTDSGKPKQDTLEESVRISKGCLGYQKSRKSVNRDPKSSERFNFRSSGSVRSGTNIPSSTSQLSAKRHAANVEAQYMKKARAIGKSPISPMSSKSCIHSLLCEDFSCKDLKKGKIKAATSVTSVLQFSSESQDKARIPLACGDKRVADSLEAELENKRSNLDSGVVSPRVSKPIKHSLESLLKSEPPFKNLENKKKEDARNVTSQIKNSNVMQGKAESPAILGDNSPKLGTHIGILRDKGSLHELRSFETADLKLKGHQARDERLQEQKVGRNSAFHDKNGKDPGMGFKSLSLNSVSSDKANATGSEVHPREDSLPDALKKFSHGKELKTSELCDPAICLPASDSGVTAVEVEKETISCEQPVISGPNCHKSGAVESCGIPDYGLKPTGCITHEDLNLINKEGMNGSWQAECPAEAITDVRVDKLCSDFASNEMSKLRKLTQFDMATPSATYAVPEDRYIWLGKFLIRSSEGIVSCCDGIQLHLSTKASPKVIEVVESFSEILLLEELPRLSTWPFQFVDRPVTEDNIALYFFPQDGHSHKTTYTRLLNNMKENDIALRGNFGGVELLIFSSHVLPENFAFWNKLPYMWGVFRGQTVGNPASTEESTSQRVWKSNRSSYLNENTDSGSWTLDLNACPPHEEDTGRIHDESRCLDLNRCFSENDEFDTTGTIHPEVGALLGRDGFSYQRQAHPSVGENNPEPEVVDLELSLWPQNSVPVETEVETELSLWPQNAVPEEPELETEQQLMPGKQAADTFISLKLG